MAPLVDPDFWRDRAVLLTGHTGFKGAWMALWLQALGARVSGLSDSVPTDPSLYELARVGDGMGDIRDDVRDYDAVLAALTARSPRSSCTSRRSRSCGARSSTRERRMRRTSWAP